MNLRTPLPIVPTFGTLELIIKEGWLVSFRDKKSGKRILEVGENSNSINTFDHNLLGLFDQQVFLAILIYSPTKETIVTTSIVTPIMFVPPIMALTTTNVLCIQLPIYDNDNLMFHLRQLTKVCVTNGENILDHKLQYFPNLFKG